jgi:putative ABC transport system permease protein
MGLYGWYLRARGALWRGRAEREMEEEMGFHLEQEIAKHMRAGMTQRAARRRALIAFGGVEASREAMRDGRGGRWLDDLLVDIRYAMRWQLRAPAFTAVAVFTLALGIGATTALFAVLNSVLFEPLPYPESDRLAMVYARNEERGGNNVSYPDYLSWKEQVKSFQQLGIFQWTSSTISGGEQAERLSSADVSADLFSVLGVAPVLGREITPAEQQQGARVALIGYGLWQRRFSGERSALGLTITVNGEPYTIIGIMPERFQFPYDGELWKPLVHEPGFALRSNRYLAGAVGRLAPGVTREQAVAELARVSAQLETSLPDSNRGWSADYVSFRQDVLGQLREGVIVLFVAAGFVLLIVCGNLANLLLARGAGRQREIALRAAIGAGRGRLVRQLLTESALLATAGAGLAVIVALWGVQLLRASATGQLPAFMDITVQPRVFFFQFALATLVVLLTGLLPALRGTQLGSQSALGHGLRTTGGARGARLRSTLIVVEVGLTVVLLAGSVLLIKTMSALNQIELGFDPANVLTARYNLPATQYSSDNPRLIFLKTIEDKLRANPGVVAVGAAQGTPFSGWNVRMSYEVRGAPPPKPGQEVNALVQMVTPTIFRTMGVPLVKGRGLEPSHASVANPNVLVNEAFVTRHFAGQDPLGRQVRIGRNGQWATIIGVIGDFRHIQVTNPALPAVYFHYAVPADVSNSKDYLPSQMTLVIRTRGPANDLIPVLRRELAELDMDVPAYRITTMQEVIDRNTWVQRILRNILAAFATTASLLAVIGLYGVISYSVNQQRHEFGIRLALGAAPAGLLRQVLRAGLLLASIGIVLGLAVALVATQGLGELLFEVQPADATTFVLVPLVVGTLAALTAAGPALRAAATPPMQALRNE